MKIKQSKTSKLHQVQEHLLTGKSITGADMFNLYHIKCHKDTIYRLRKKGLEISSVSESHSDGKHARWFMTSAQVQAYNNSKEVTA